MEREKFKCTKCGACCKYISNIEEVKHMDRGDGVCKYYNEETRECLIYDFRPDICNMEKWYEKKRKKEMTWEQYLEKNYEACKVLEEYDKEQEKKKKF